MASVTSARVPSEPTISWVRSYPVLALRCFPPARSTSPEASTASTPSTWWRVTPYLTARIPPAFVAMVPPMLALHPQHRGDLGGAARPDHESRCPGGDAQGLVVSVVREAVVRETGARRQDVVRAHGPGEQRSHIRHRGLRHLLGSGVLQEAFGFTPR